MTDIELLPLPQWTQYNAHLRIRANSLQKRVQAYARANVAHAAAPLQAEIERLRAEREVIDALRSRLEDSVRDGLNEHCRAERLAEALHKLEDSCEDSDGAQYGTLATSFVRGICKDALRDHDRNDE